MAKYVATRLLEAVIAVWGVATLVFFFIRLSGDPTVLMLPPGSSREQLDQLRHALGFDQPLAEQYGQFMSQIFRGDLPESLVYGQPSLTVVVQHLAATAELAAAAILIAVTVGTFLGLLAARFRGRYGSILVTAVMVLGQAVPTFWFGLMAILVFGVQLRWLPVAGIGGISHLILPAVTLSIYSIASIGRMFRSSLLDIEGADFIRTADAKGLFPLRVLARHTIPNALLPVVTVVGLQVGHLLGGAVITEVVFAWPGVGQLLVSAINQHDFSLVETAVMVIATIFVIVNLCTDLLYGVIDPRIRLAGGSS